MNKQISTTLLRVRNLEHLPPKLELTTICLKMIHWIRVKESRISKSMGWHLIPNTQLKTVRLSRKLSKKISYPILLFKMTLKGNGLVLQRKEYKMKTWRLKSINRRSRKPSRNQWAIRVKAFFKVWKKVKLFYLMGKPRKEKQLKRGKARKLEISKRLWLMRRPSSKKSN